MLGTHAQRLVLAGVVFAEERAQALVEFVHRFIAADEDVVILYCAPKPLDHDVVQCSAFAVHADSYPPAVQNSGERVAGILAALVGIEDLRHAFGLQSLLQAIDAKRRIQTVTELPADHIAARPINHSSQVNMAIAQRNVGDVRAPDMVAALDLKPSEQVGILFVPFTRSAQTRLRVDRFDPHDPHQAPDTIPPQLVAQ